MADVQLRINMRPEQKALYLDAKRFNVRVCHRRFGKTWLAIVELLVDAVMTKRPDWRGYYIGPTFKQTKRVAWDYLKAFVKDFPNIQINEAELRVDFENGSRIQLLGAETYDSLRGQYADKAVLDECQLIPSAAWTQVMRPMLADREGAAVFMGTPAGRMNLLFDLKEFAERGEDADWSAHVVPVSATDIISPKEIEAMKREMSEADYAQELECSFTAAIRGAYYAKEMQAAQAQGRIAKIKYDAALPVTAVCDLGWSDLTVFHFVQTLGTEHHFIATRAFQQTKIADMMHELKKLPFPIDALVLPHDAEAHDLSSGMRRREIFEQFCEDVSVAPRVKSKHEGIEQVRHILPHCWFDRDECATTIEALTQYRADYDEVKRVMKISPVHDWTSHYVDAVQTYATGMPDTHLSWVGDPRAVAQNAKRKWFA